jgi:GT2 family glycosyltransferase
MDHSTPEELAHIQAQLAHLQSDLEQIRAYARNLFFQNEDLQKRLQSLAFIERSRAWYWLKRARIPLRVLLTEGPLAFSRRLSSWVARNRGALWSNRSVKSAHSADAHHHSPADWHVARQHVSDSSSFQGASIIIPVFNALEYAQACVESIYRARCTVPFEVIIVDNGSRPEVGAWLEEACQKKSSLFYISLSHNLGFAKAVNLGLQQARGQYLVLHNSDTVVTSGWLDQLVSAVESDPLLGIVSPVTNYVGEGEQLDQAAKSLSVKKAERYAATISRRKGLIYVPDRLVFFSVLLKRSVLETIGGLDEIFQLGNFEDEEYCLRARLAGFKLAIASNTFVYHHGSKTFAANQINHTQWMLGNQRRYLDKVSACSVEFPPRRARRPQPESIEVSVIVRTYNRPETLRLALTSLARQTFDAFEVVLVNDGGEPLTALLAEFEGYFPIRCLHHSERKGPGAALNTGIRGAQGRWITYLDDDDIVYPSHLETLWTALTQAGGTNKLFAYSAYNRALLDGRGVGAATLARLPMPAWNGKRRDLLVDNQLPLHTWMHARALFDTIGAFDEQLVFFEDWDFLLRAARHCAFVPVNRITCEYRFYLDSTNSTVQQRERHLDQIERMYARYPVKGAISRVRRARMRQGVAFEIAQIERLKACGEQHLLGSAELQRQVLAVIAGFQTETI